MERIGAELVLLDRTAQKVHRLDAFGTEILDLCNGQNAGLDIAEQLAPNYQTAEQQLQHDVKTFLGLLRTAGIIV